MIGTGKDIKKCEACLLPFRELIIIETGYYRLKAMAIEKSQSRDLSREDDQEPKE